MTVSEPKQVDGERIEWIDKKKQYAKQLRKGPIKAVMIAAADKTHNFRSIVEEYYEDYDAFLRDFGPHLDSRLEAYQTIANAINSRLQDGIVHEFNNTFKAFNEFLCDVQEYLDR